MICYICKFNLPTFSELAFIHFLGTLSTYECSEDQCSQTFQNLNGLRRHISRKHYIKNVETTSFNKEIDESNNTSTFVGQLADNLDTLVTNENTTPAIINSTNVFNLKEALNILNLSAIKFSFQLHNYNNFSRKDVVSIQNGISNKILNLIICLLKGSVQDNIKDPSLLSTMDIVLSEMSELFKFCSSEYQLI